MPIDFTLELFIPDDWVKIKNQENINNALNYEGTLHHTICSPDFIGIFFHNPETSGFYDDSMVALYDKVKKWLYVSPKSSFYRVVHQNDN